MSDLNRETVENRELSVTLSGLCPDTKEAETVEFYIRTVTNIWSQKSQESMVVVYRDKEGKNTFEQFYKDVEMARKHYKQLVKQGYTKM